MSVVAGTESVRLAELAASLSLATDIGLGVALEHAQRSALMTVALADAAGFDADDARDAFYVALLKTVGCTGDEDFGVRVLGEDSGNWIAHMAGGSPAEFMGALLRNVGRSDAFPRRVGKVLHALRKGPGMPSRAHCEVGRLLAERLGLSARVARAMTQVFERWDGRGRPDGLKGEAIDRVVRLVQLASDAQAARRLFGTDETVALIRRRAGGGYDPKLVEVFSRRAKTLFAALEVTSVHDALVEAEPGEPLRLTGDALDAAIETVGQYGDMKSRFTRGHSAGVAALAGRAAERQGLAEATAVRRAGHLHDIGRAGVVLDIWDPDAPRFARPGGDAGGAGARAARRRRLPPAAARGGRSGGRAPPRRRGRVPRDDGAATASRGADARAGGEGGARRRAGGPTRSRRRRGGARRRRPARRQQEANARRRVDRARARGRSPARAWPHQQGDRVGARHLGQDGRPPRAAHLREGRRHDAAALFAMQSGLVDLGGPSP